MAQDKTLHLTPLPDFMVPPPLSHLQVTFDRTIRNYSISKDAALVETIDSGLFLVQFGFPDEHRVLRLPNDIWEMDEESDQPELCVKQVHLETLSEDGSFGGDKEPDHWTPQDYLICRVRKNLREPEEGEELSVARIRVASGATEEPGLDSGGSDQLARVTPEVRMCSIVPVESFHKILQIKLMTASEGTRALVLFTSQNSSLRVEIPEDCEEPPEEAEEQDPLDEQVKLIDWAEDAEGGCAVYVNDNDSLFVGEQKLADDVTSFIIEGDFLLYTVNTQIPYDHLFTQRLAQIRSRTHAKCQGSTSSTNRDWRVRNIEKGARLVCTGHDKVVLQMPRGNLESIFSRIFLLESAEKLVNKRDYRGAFGLLRKHKMSLSLLVDLDPAGFRSFVESGQILRELSPKQLDLLVVAFSDLFGNELDFLFSEEQARAKREQNGAIWGPEKVNSLCGLLLGQLQDDQFSRIKNEMVVFSKTDPPSLADGLRRIKQLKQARESHEKTLLDHLKAQRGKNPHSNQQLFDERGQVVQSGRVGWTASVGAGYKDTLKYFCWLVDAEELFRESLLIFDLELAVMVAEFTQKDPKDYLPYVEALKRMEDPLARRVRICRDLNRDGAALEQIRDHFAESGQQVDATNVDRLLQIANESGLHAKALELFGASESLNKALRRSLADKMNKSKDFKGAADMYLSTGEHAKALECFEKILDWKSGVQVLQKMGKGDSAQIFREQCQFLTRIKPKFEKLKSYRELAEMSVFMRQSGLKTAELLLRGHFFRECKSLMNERNLWEEREKGEEWESFRRELLLQASVQSNLHVDMLANLHKWRARLKAVKREKRQMLERIVNGDIPEEMQASEHLSAFSQTSGQSSVSAFSILTGVGMGGNKRRGKKPKNLIRRKVKEGSVYEEEWLAQSINAMDLTLEHEKSVSHLLSLLVRMGAISEARAALRQYRMTKAEVQNKGIVKTVLQEEFEKANVEVFEIYSHLEEFDSTEISRGSKKIKPFQILQKFDYLNTE